MLRMYWDGETTPSVECPLGDFFAMGHGIDAPVDSIPVRVVSEGRARNCYWPMPFAKSAKITVTNEGAMPVKSFYSYVDWRTLPKLPKNTAYFHAMYRQEFPTAMGKRYLFADIEGRGHYVGTVLSVRHRTASWFGEGDDFFYVDGEKEPGLRGTGTEDYFCDAWGFRRQSGPYYGAPLYDGENPGSRSTVYRWHVTDPIVFQKSLRAEIEHVGPVLDFAGRMVQDYGERTDDFSSVSFWYQAEPHKPWPAPPAGHDRLTDGLRITDAILSGAGATEEKAEQLTFLFRRTALLYTHAQVDAPQLENLALAIPLENEASVPLRYRVELRPQETPAAVLGAATGEIASASKQTVGIAALVAPALPVEQASLMTLVWNFTYADPAGKPVSFSLSQPCGIDSAFTIPKIANAVVVDGDMADWKDLPFTVRHPAQLIADSPNPPWDGPDDSSYRFALARDNHLLYIAVEAFDDVVIAAPNVPTWEQDGIEVRIDARPKTEWHKDDPHSDPSPLFIAVSPSDAPNDAHAFEPARWPEGTKAVCRKTPTGYCAEIAVPVAHLNAMQGKDWEACRFNICLDDIDVPKKDVVQLWWRPDWRRSENYIASGTFVKK